MTSEKWLEKAREHRVKLLALVSEYHPSRLAPYSQRQNPNLPITAPNAELAVENCRVSIAKETKNQGDPRELFNQALDSGEWSIVYQILDQTWFGVPESTSCWRLEGFSQAVDLLEDPPEDENTLEATA